MKTLITILSLLLAFSYTALSVNPVASNVSISGVNHVGTTLTGSYDFSDGDGDLESGTTYQWYRSDDQAGTNKTAIAGATSTTYTLTTSEFGKYITFEVTPRDDNAETGTAVESGYSDYIYDYADVNLGNGQTFSTTDDAISELENRGSFTTNNNTTINVYDLDSLIIWLDFIVNNNLTINIESGGYFEVKGTLDAKNGAALDVSGEIVVSGDVLVEQNATFTIAEGGSMDVSGDLQTGDNADLTIEGDVSVDGNVDIGNNSSVTVDSDGDGGGTLTVGGDLSGGTGTTINGSGPVSVGGSVSGDPGFTGDSQLPIELVTFSAQFTNGSVQLDWTTAAEINNDYFTVERSADGIRFEKILQVSGQGNSSQIVYYTEYDYHPLDGISYYRLKQTDYDGQYSYSNIIGVHNSLLKSTGKVNVFPNPYHAGYEILNVQVTDFDQDETINIKVVDITGRVIYESQDNADAAIKTIQLSNETPKGAYFVIISNSYEKQVRKILIN